MPFSVLSCLQIRVAYASASLCLSLPPPLFPWRAVLFFYRRGFSSSLHQLRRALNIRVYATRITNHSLFKFPMSTGPGLESLVDQTISVITNDGRNIVGVLKGFDQATNIILDESHERVYSTKEGVQQLVLGLYIIRGDNISIVGELDEELDSSLDLSNLRAHPLKPVIH